MAAQEVPQALAHTGYIGQPDRNRLCGFARPATASMSGWVYIPEPRRLQVLQEPDLHESLVLPLLRAPPTQRGVQLLRLPSSRNAKRAVSNKRVRHGGNRLNYPSCPARIGDPIRRTVDLRYRLAGSRGTAAGAPGVRSLPGPVTPKSRPGGSWMAGRRCCRTRARPGGSARARRPRGSGPSPE